MYREDRPEVQKALQELLYVEGGLKGARLSVLLNGAMGVVARTKGGAFVDFDTIPEESVPLPQALSYLLSPAARSLRQVLITEAVTAADILLRQAARKAFAAVVNLVPRPPLFVGLLPSPETLPAPFLLPSPAGRPVPVIVPPSRLLDAAAPKLTREEEVYGISLIELVSGSLGRDAATVMAGDALLEPRAVARLLYTILSTGRAPALDAVPPQLRSGGLELLAALAGQRVGVSLGGGGGAGGAAAEEVMDAIEGLTVEERETLEAAGGEVASALWQTLLDRLAPLATASGVPSSWWNRPPQPPSQPSIYQPPHDPLTAPPPSPSAGQARTGTVPVHVPMEASEGRREAVAVAA